MNPTLNTSSALPNNLALLQTLLASNLSNISTSLQPNYNQLINQPQASPTHASVANNRKDKPVLVKRKFESEDESGSDSSTKKIFTNTSEPVIRTPIPLVSNQPLIPKPLPNQNLTSNPTLLRNLQQLYQLLQLNALLKNKNAPLGPNPSQKPLNLRPTSASQLADRDQNDIKIKIEDQYSDQKIRPEASTAPGTTRSYYSRNRKPDFSKNFEAYDSDGDSTNLSESNEPRPPITEPALVEFTRDFPDWGLADIFTFLTTGQPKKDITPVRRSVRPVVKSSSQDQEKSSLTQEEEVHMVGDCKQEIKDLLGMDDVNESKVKLMLKKNEMKVDRVVGTVKKNLPFYKKYFTIKK